MYGPLLGMVIGGAMMAWAAPGLLGDPATRDLAVASLFVALLATAGVLGALTMLLLDMRRAGRGR